MGLLDGLSQNYQNGIQGIQQIFQNAGYNNQQTGQSVAKGLMPRALGGQGYVSPAYGSGVSSGNYKYQAPSSAGTGQVLGATDTKTSGGGGGTTSVDRSGVQNQDYYLNEFGQRVNMNQGQSNEVNEREMALRNTINSGFDNLKSGYNDLIPYFQQEGDRRVGQVGETYQNIFSGLDQAKQAGMDKLGLAREEVGRRSASSITDLKQNLNQVMRNTGMQLGAMGAGDTSASQVMAPYAYTKMAGQEFGGIQKQANDQFGQIDTKGVDLEQEYGQMYNQTEIEKASAIESVKSEVGQQIARIREMIPQVDAQRAQALAGLEQSLLTNAQNTLTQIQAEDRQRKDSLQQWALQRVAQLQDAQLSLKNTSNFDPQAIAFNELQSVGAMPAYGQSESVAPGYSLTRRKELGLA